MRTHSRRFAAVWTAVVGAHGRAGVCDSREAVTKCCDRFSVPVGNNAIPYPIEHVTSLTPDPAVGQGSGQKNGPAIRTRTGPFGEVVLDAAEHITAWRGCRGADAIPMLWHPQVAHGATLLSSVSGVTLRAVATATTANHRSRVIRAGPRRRPEPERDDLAATELVIVPNPTGPATRVCPRCGREQELIAFPVLVHGFRSAGCEVCQEDFETNVMQRGMDLRQLARVAVPDSRPAVRLRAALARRRRQGLAWSDRVFDSLIETVLTALTDDERRGWPEVLMETRTAWRAAYERSATVLVLASDLDVAGVPHVG